VLRFLNSAVDINFNQAVANFFINELLACRGGGEYTFYLISPWISDVSFDMGGRNIFSNLFSGGQVSLLDLMRKMLEMGGKVKVASLCAGTGEASETGTLDFLEQLERSDHNNLLQVSLFSDLHAKIYAGRAGAMVGSPNITHNGVFNYKEFAVYFSEQEKVEELAQHAHSIWESNKNKVAFPGMGV